LAVLVGAAGILVAPATAAQASTAPVTTSACAPTAEASWLGTFNGPHVNEGNDNRVSNQEIVVLVAGDGHLTVKFDGALDTPTGYSHAWGDTATGLLRNLEPDHPIMGLDTTSATCDANGDVASFAGTYYHFYNWSSCWGCVSWGTFEVTRV